tara:strand:+ start:377 stop:889 length:513 start_codon:yes stop_codon:yes gene_type:complete
MKKLIELIETYEDFPCAGIEFKDVLGIIQEPKIFKELILKMSSSQIIKNSEAIISIDARGFIFGSAISFQASKPMIVARKPGKLPGDLYKKDYSLEYGENSLSVQKKAFQKYNSFAIVDDLLATGGTVNCLSELLKCNQKEATGLLVVVELRKLDGRSRFDFPVESSILL